MDHKSTIRHEQETGNGVTLYGNSLPEQDSADAIAVEIDGIEQRLDAVISKVTQALTR